MSRIVFVGNIPFNYTEEQLVDVFQEVGRVKKFRLVFDRVTGKPRGYGFCEFYDAETAASAVRNLDQTEVGDRKLKVGFADYDPSGQENGAGGSGRWDRSDDANNGQHPMHNSPPQHSVNMDGTSDRSGIPVSDQITSILASYSTPELLNILKQMKEFMAAKPVEARKHLLENPQITYTLFQALLLTNLISPEMVTQLVNNVAPAAVAANNNNNGAGQPSGQENLGASEPTAAAASVSSLEQQQKALLIQVMKMTQAQIDALPPDQKAQILQLKAHLANSNFQV